MRKTAEKFGAFFLWEFCCLEAFGLLRGSASPSVSPFIAPFLRNVALSFGNSRYARVPFAGSKPSSLRDLSFRLARRLRRIFLKISVSSRPPTRFRPANSGRSPCLLCLSPSRFTPRILRCRFSAFFATLLRSVASGSELPLCFISSLGAEPALSLVSAFRSEPSARGRIYPDCDDA